jgi:hypothetical protein
MVPGVKPINQSTLPNYLQYGYLTLWDMGCILQYPIYTIINNNKKYDWLIGLVLGIIVDNQCQPDTFLLKPRLVLDLSRKPILIVSQI